MASALKYLVLLQFLHIEGQAESKPTHVKQMFLKGREALWLRDQGKSAVCNSVSWLAMLIVEWK